MLDTKKLHDILADYKEDFFKQWKNEKYKWVAVKHFQDHWDINAKDFLKMFTIATEKTGNLLVSRNNFPRLTIQYFAERDPEAVRAMFINLFDETKDLVERYERFEAEAEKLKEKYFEDKGKQHYQHLNAITTYLWLKYPDKYYIFKFSVNRDVAKELDNSLMPKRGKPKESMIDGYRLYDEICNKLSADKELIQMLQSVLTSECYPDKKLRTLTMDLGFYISKIYTNKTYRSEWFPKDYSPNISTEQWLELLANKDVFTPSSLAIMKRMKDIGGIATCKQLSIHYGETPNFYNAGSSSLAKRVAEKTNCPLLTKNNENSKWWPILYLGKYVDKETEGVYAWKLRDELSLALDRFDLSAIPLYASQDNLVSTKRHYSKDDFLNDVYMSSENFDTLVSLLKHKKNVILQGAPGVGKTFTAKRLAYAIMGEIDEDRIELVQFHQSYSYEDFVMGYKPKGNEFELQEGIFYRFCKRAEKNPEKEFFFIIDEINRGNLSKIFGELLMLIEKDYRGIKATLAYSKMQFTVPENLYIIGMMNTADRSLALIDYALRRRFSFYEMEPGFNSDGFKIYQEKLANDTFNDLIERIKELNRNITNDSSLGKGFCIGHSYFCNQDECTDEWMVEIIEYDIIPMLREYWFDEPAKLQEWANKLRGVFND